MRNWGRAFLALFLAAMAIPAHAGVNKWVDENERPHYADQPPSIGEHTQLHVQDAPIQAAPSEPQDGSEESQMQQDVRQRHQKKMEERDRLLKEANAKELAEQEKERIKQRRRDYQLAEDKKSKDAALIAECKRNREIYCDQGVDKIKKEDMRRADWTN